MDHLTLDPDDHLRLLALSHLTEGRLTLGEVAERLKLSERQVRRLHRAFLQSGPVALVHGNRRRRPANALDADLVARIRDLATTKYAGFNHQYLAEMLEAEEGIKIARRTLSRHLTAGGHSSPRPHASRLHRRRRERRSQEGLLVQADGSQHPWVGDRGPKFTLVAGIDDATSRAWAHFRESEDTQGYFRLLRAIVSDRGIPHTWYTDRSSIFAVSDRSTRQDPLSDDPHHTQFGRLLGELGVELILARSPQGKGRIERFFDTAQDRLVSLLRLHNACTIPDANRVLSLFLRQFHQRFGVQSRHPEPAWLPWSHSLAADDVFCFKYTRILARDHTVSLHGISYQIPPEADRCPGRPVTVHQWFDRTVRIFHGHNLLVTHTPHVEPPQPSIPAANHPWRRPLSAPRETTQ
jgi:transposase